MLGVGEMCCQYRWAHWVITNNLLFIKYALFGANIKNYRFYLKYKLGIDLSDIQYICKYFKNYNWKVVGGWIDKGWWRGTLGEGRLGLGLTMGKHVFYKHYFALLIYCCSVLLVSLSTLKTINSMYNIKYLYFITIHSKGLDIF